jgi:uncharacterized protein
MKKSTVKKSKRSPGDSAAVAEPTKTAVAKGGKKGEKKRAKQDAKKDSKKDPKKVAKKSGKSDRLTTAAALFAAIESRSPDAVAALYADDVQVWHNFSNACQDKPTNLAVLTGLCQSVPEIRYDVVERLLLDDGRVLQRHVLRATVASGEEILIPACMFITVARGRIARIEEYLDTGQANRLRQATGRPPVAVPDTAPPAA